MKMAVFWVLTHAVSWKFTYVSEVPAVSIIRPVSQFEQNNHKKSYHIYKVK
jgi:hypothetical protein